MKVEPLNEVVLYDYWRSSASYRVRIALNLAGISYKARKVDLLNKDHKSAAYLDIHPQGLVPVLKIDGHSFTQSLAILDYLDRTRTLGLLPEDASLRAKIMAIAHTLAVDVHPVCNLGVVQHVSELVGDNNDRVKEDWMMHFILPGLRAFERQLASFEMTPFINGEKPSLAEICLIPQLYNADRWGVDYSDCQKLRALAGSCGRLEAFQDAHPDQVNL